MPPSNSIFISYRRSDSNDVVGRIYDRLCAHFGQDVVFKDVESIPYGDDFRTHLIRTVSHCRAVLVVIGPSWLETLTQRLAAVDQHDWVRIEIETALSRETEIPVIPVLVGGAYMPAGDDLPESLKPLAYRNAAQARPDPDFHADLNRLIQRLEDIVGPSELKQNAQSNSDSKPLEPTPAAIAAPSSQALQSQSIGNITISGSHNPFNAVQATGDVTITQSQSQTPVTDPDLQQAMKAIEALKQAIAATDAMDDTEKSMTAIPIQKLENELQSPQPDQPVIEKAIATIKKMASGVPSITGLVDKVAALTLHV